jgi:(E)-4-hydroxy-3-methylbut-2-enyl-diphosphate synthase
MATKVIKIKNVLIGGGNPVAVQTMTNTLTADVAKTMAQIKRLEAVGADIVRVAVPCGDSVKALKQIVKQANVPIVADIHYDFKLALGAIEAGAHKIRINPANIKKQGVVEIVRLAKERDVPIRVGVNEGSLEAAVSPMQLASLAADSAKLLEDNDFFNIILAAKSSSVLNTVLANRELSKLTNYPLHIGLTEAGTYNMGSLKSAIAIGGLLLDGIGDTIRVSLADEPENEIIFGKKLLRAAGVDKNFVEVVACPTCARCSIDVFNLAKELENVTASIKKPTKVAVMGCAVNGIGESKGADLGICGGKETSAIFKDGKIIKTVKNDQILQELLNFINNL